MIECQKCHQLFPENQTKEFWTFIFRIPIKRILCNKCIEIKKNKLNKQLNIFSPIYILLIGLTIIVLLFLMITVVIH
jgi:hypothetical protein